MTNGIIVYVPESLPRPTTDGELVFVTGIYNVVARSHDGRWWSVEDGTEIPAIPLIRAKQPSMGPYR